MVMQKMVAVINLLMTGLVLSFSIKRQVCANETAMTNTLPNDFSKISDLPSTQIAIKVSIKERIAKPIPAWLNDFSPGRRMTKEQHKPKRQVTPMEQVVSNIFSSISPIFPIKRVTMPASAATPKQATNDLMNKSFKWFFSAEIVWFIAINI